MTKDNPATAHDIINILGSIDDEVVTAIGHTRATCAEVQQAKAWLNEDYPVGSYIQKKFVSTRVQRVYDILIDERDRYTTYETG